MSENLPEDATQRLNGFLLGNASSESAFLETLTRELRDLAAHHLGRQAAHHTLQPTALVHEAWIRMMDSENLQVDARAQFFALASRTIRSVLIDHERARNAAKRGGQRGRITCQDDLEEAAGSSRDLIDVDEALGKLTRLDAELGRLVELRFFGGLTNDEIATLNGVSLRTVNRQWRTARAWLRTELGEA